MVTAALAGLGYRGGGCATGKRGVCILQGGHDARSVAQQDRTSKRLARNRKHGCRDPALVETWILVLVVLVVVARCFPNGVVPRSLLLFLFLLLFVRVLAAAVAAWYEAPCCASRRRVH